MVEQPEFESVWGKIESDLEKIGVESIEEDVREAEDSEIHQLSGTFGDDYIFVESVPELCYARVTYYYSFGTDIGQSLDEERADSIVHTDDSELLQSLKEEDHYEERIELLAGISLLNELPEEQMAHLNQQLSDRLISPLTRYEIYAESGVVYGFHVARSIFPYVDDYDLRDLYNTSEAVTSIGRRGFNYLNSTFDIDLEGVGEGDIRISLDM